MDINPITLVTFSLLAYSLNSAYACSPPLGVEPASIAKKAQNSSYVFDGTVTEITDTYIKIKVQQYFKGTGFSKVKISREGENSCTDHFVLEQRALFFTQGNMQGLLESVYDGAFGSAREMSAENFSKITAATECMATYSDGLLTVPCISHQGTETVYQASLEPIGSVSNFQFLVNQVAPVTKVQYINNFDQGRSGTVPGNWIEGITGIGNSDWKLVEDNTAPSSPLVLKQSGDGDFPWCIKEDSLLSDGFVSVKFKPISGTVDQAAGIIWRWKGAFNYYVVRANALEDNISIYYMKDGQRNTIQYVDLPRDMPVKQNVWQTLRVD